MLGWMMRIAEHEIRDRADFHGRQQRDVKREEDVADHGGLRARTRSALSRLIAGEQSERLDAALAVLSDAHRQVILLRTFEELSFGEIGKILGKSEDASRMLFARAMTALTLALSKTPTPMTTSADLEDRLARFVEHHVVHGRRLPLDELCADRPALVEALRPLVDQYLSLTTSLSGDAGTQAAARVAPSRALPSFPGFETIERLGGGGMGKVYKLKDRSSIASSPARSSTRDRAVRRRLAEFLREARSLALFSDPRIVRIFEFRAGRPAGDRHGVRRGFRARTHRSVARVRASARGSSARSATRCITRTPLGIQHRDLKPSNIMVDAALRPQDPRLRPERQAIPPRDI